MEERYDIQRLLALRKLTRGVSELLRGQLTAYLSTLAPLINPKAVFGDYVQGGGKEVVRGADTVFEELQALYGAVASSKPYNLPKELKLPIGIAGTALEITPVEYVHVAKTERESKKVSVASPLKWAFNYRGFPPRRLAELLGNRNRDTEELQRAVLHALVMHVVLSKRAGVTQILDALHFHVNTGRSPEFGDLPLTYISSSVSTTRPPDEVIIESTEVAGRDSFEEVVNLDDIATLRDPLKEQLLELVKTHGESSSPQ
ncbi:MAG: hypothetical protein JOZ96_24240 [Acidobacteria bacterium]|nr:hypothetical protein [Acidobacteriota bacterium]